MSADPKTQLYQRELLAQILDSIGENTFNYSVRDPLILKAIGMANKCGFPVGFRTDADDHWAIVVIHLPNGQVSWHMKPDPISYDGHTPAEKFARIKEFGEPYLI